VNPHALVALGVGLFAGGAEALMLPEQLASTLGPATLEVATVVARSDERLGECMRRLGDGAGKVEDYLRAQQIDLNADGKPDYFVMPELKCSDEFLGAHAMSFWLLAGRERGGFKVVLSDAEDSVKLLDSRTNGFRDVEVTYSVTVMLLHYNGRHYAGHKL
jgi:hypothetical protein